MSKLYIKKLSENAKIPIRKTLGSAGYDLHSAKDLHIDPHGKAIVPTDLSIKVEDGYYGRIAPRSGMSWKNHTDIGAGVIDSDYRGAVGVVIFNHSKNRLEIVKGDRVAQLIIERISTPEIIEVDELDETKRGSGGYGSTGK
jgi:dUTP pyrophosphatase